MNLTQKQQSVLVGTVLGDAYIQKTGKNNARLRLEHGAVQKEYLNWKVKIFSNLFQNGSKYIERENPKSSKKYFYYRNQSNTDPVLGKWRDIFYPEGKKQIPEMLSELLTPLALAVWYMDDGYYYARDKTSYLYLGRVSRKEAELVRSGFAKKFNLNTTIYDKKRKGFAVYFPVKETVKLHSIVKSYILPQFSYKLGEK